MRIRRGPKTVLRECTVSSSILFMIGRNMLLSTLEQGDTAPMVGTFDDAF